MPHILYVHDLDFNAIPKKRKVNPSKKYFFMVCGNLSNPNSFNSLDQYFFEIWPVMTSKMCSQWQSFIWSLIGPTGFFSFPGSMSRLGCQNGHLNIEMRHTTEFPEIMQNDSVSIEFIFKKIIFVRRAQRTEFNISSKKMSRHIPIAYGRSTWFDSMYLSYIILDHPMDCLLIFN